MNAGSGRAESRTPAQTLALGWLAAAGALMMFGNSLRASLADGFGWAATFTALARLAGQPRWAWAKAGFAAAAAFLGHLIGVVLADPGVAAGDITEGIARGAGVVVVLLWLAWRTQRRNDPARAG